MDPKLRIAAQQLSRMRGMTALYHRQFFSDIRFTTAVGFVIVVLAVVYDRRLFALLPVAALLGACQTAFDASYLVFARHYARSLEAYLNRRLGEDVLVAARLEDRYLFPLDERKLVTLPLRGGLTWFGFMTALYTLTGAGFFVVGLAASYEAIGGPWNDVFLWVMLVAAGVALVVGFRWFWGGEGERRLRAVLDTYP
jgi:hypothetical protein